MCEWVFVCPCVPHPVCVEETLSMGWTCANVAETRMSLLVLAAPGAPSPDQPLRPSLPSAPSCEPRGAGPAQPPSAGPPPEARGAGGLTGFPVVPGTPRGPSCPLAPCPGHKEGGETSWGSCPRPHAGPSQGQPTHQSRWMQTAGQGAEVQACGNHNPLAVELCLLSCPFLATPGGYVSALTLHVNGAPRDKVAQVLRASQRPPGI